MARGGATFADTSFIRIPEGQGAGISYAPYDSNVGLPPEHVAILFLSRASGNGQPAWTECPHGPALADESAVVGTGRGSAFSITTDRPVVAYTMWPYGAVSGAITSASMLVPATAWDTNYIAINPYEKGAIVPQQLRPSLALLARQDATEVTILPRVAIEGSSENGVAPTPANAPVTYMLDAGEYVQLAQTAELTGSIIQASVPVGVWGAADCFNVPSGAGACDSAHQQLWPVRAMGHRYAGVRYRNRLAAPTEEAPPWRLVGAVDGTILTWTPTAPSGAPATLDRGQVAEFWTTGPFIVESQDAQHPFYAGQYMTGCTHVSANPMMVCEGDPEWVHMIPPQQFLERYVFFTDPTYPETNLVVVRSRSASTMKFADVVLDCAGPLEGWEPLGDDLEYTRVDLVTGDFDSVGGCANGRHEITSSEPFGVTVWGWGGQSQSIDTSAVSYAYPAGASLRPINDVTIPSAPE